MINAMTEREVSERVALEAAGNRACWSEYFQGPGPAGLNMTHVSCRALMHYAATTTRLFERSFV